MNYAYFIVCANSFSVNVSNKWMYERICESETVMKSEKKRWLIKNALYDRWSLNANNFPGLMKLLILCAHVRVRVIISLYFYLSICLLCMLPQCNKHNNLAPIYTLRYARWWHLRDNSCVPHTQHNLN